MTTVDQFYLVISEVPNVNGIAMPPAVVGPFGSHYLAFRWGNENLNRVGWRVVELVPRVEAARLYRRGWRRRLNPLAARSA